MSVDREQSSRSDDTALGSKLGSDSAISWYYLGLMTFAYSLAYIDRQLLNLVVDPIKRSMLLTDTQFSFIQGIAFISAYIMAAPFFGRLVDITNRRNILMAGVFLWSLFTMLCGFADTYWELAAARFAVGVAEACVFPVALSLIPEFFTQRGASRALSIFSLGSNLGGAFSLLAGGGIIAAAAAIVLHVPMLGGLETWQLAFVLVGIPGFAFAALLLTMKEPPRQRSSREASTLTTRESLEMIWSRRSFYLRMYLVTGMNGTIALGVAGWYPTLLVRVFHLPIAEVGIKVGLVSLICGAIGTLLSPVAMNFMAQRGYEDAPLRVAAIGVACNVICCLLIPAAPTFEVALAIFGAIVFCCGIPIGVMVYALQRATDRRIRGMVASLWTLSAQLVGFGVGPTAIALATDYIFGDPSRVGSSLQLVCATAACVEVLALTTNFKNYRAAIKMGF